jgi:LPS-assembly protein
VLDFQTVDPTISVADRPYKELPRIRFSAAPATRPLGLQFSLDSEAVEFEKNDTVTGTRVDLQPRLTLPIDKAAYYIKPEASLRYTRYRLHDPAPGNPDDPARITPVASLDSGLFFDRPLDWRSSSYVQTLEPRLFYLYVPNKNQDDLPVFDTGDYDFNFWQLFLENRFSGPDRMGDANQLALALTTRILDPATGQQKFSASLGNLLYFRDREVTLPGDPVATDRSSDIIGQLRMTLGGGWLARTEVQWNPGETHTNRANALLRYQAGPRQLVNLSYRFRRDTLEQTDISFLWPIGRNWRVVGRWNYSIDDNQTLETIAGIGYESCCWAINLVGRSYVNEENGGRTTGIYAELELKGLTRLGNSIDNLLERGILGYESDY